MRNIQKSIYITPEEDQRLRNIFPELSSANMREVLREGIDSLENKKMSLEELKLKYKKSIDEMVIISNLIADKEAEEEINAILAKREEKGPC